MSLEHPAPGDFAPYEGGALKPHPAVLFDPLPGGRAKCRVCPIECVLPEGRIGVCGTRVNLSGRIHTLTYGVVASGCDDPIEKKPFFHFYPGSRVFTVGSIGCNFRCPGCQNWEVSHTKMKGVWPAASLENPEGGVALPGLVFLPPEGLVEAARRSGCQGVAWSYNDPSIWIEYVRDSAQKAHEAGLYTATVSNGYWTEEALDYVAPWLDGFKVDLKGFSRETYKRVAGIAAFEPVLAAAERALKKWNLHVEIVTNVTPTVSDDPEELRRAARWIRRNLGPDVPWHVTRFYPHLDLAHLPPTPIETLERARAIGLEEGLRFVYLGNVPGHPAEHTYCPGCGAVAIERDGFGIVGWHLDPQGKCRGCGAALPIRGAPHLREGRSSGSRWRVV